MMVVSFDVSDAKRLYRVARELGNFGSRVQKSVFECHLDQNQLEELQKRLACLIIEEKDKVRYYQLCAKDERALVLDGPGKKTADYDYLAV